MIRVAGARHPIVGGLLIFLIAVMSASAIGASVGLLQSPVPLAAVLVAIGGAAMMIRPEVATIVFAFALYVNAPDISVAFYGVPFAIAAGFVLLLAIPIVSFWRREKALLTRTPALLPLLAFSAAAILSTLLAVTLEPAVDWLATFAGEGVILYLLVTSAIRSGETLDRVIWAILFAGAVMAGLSVIQEVTQSYGQNFGGFAQITSRGIVVSESAIGEIRQPRLSGPIGEQNRYAQILLVLLPLAVYQFRRHGRSWMGGAALAAGAAILAGMTLTYSRGALIGLAVIAGTMLLLGYARGKQLVLIGVLIGAGAVTAGPVLVDRIVSLAAVEDAFSTEGGTSDGSLRFRATVNLAAWNVFLDHPVLGVGPGLFETTYSTRYANETGLNTFASGAQAPAHNLYLAIAAELGIVGLVAIAAAVGISLWRLIQLRRWWVSRDRLRSDLATAFALSLLAYLVTGVFLHLAYMRYFWFLLALANAAIWVLSRDQRALVDAEPAMASTHHSGTLTTRAEG